MKISLTEKRNSGSPDSGGGNHRLKHHGQPEKGSPSSGFNEGAVNLSKKKKKRKKTLDNPRLRQYVISNSVNNTVTSDSKENVYEGNNFLISMLGGG